MLQIVLLLHVCIAKLSNVISPFQSTCLWSYIVCNRRVVYYVNSLASSRNRSIVSTICLVGSREVF